MKRVLIAVGVVLAIALPTGAAAVIDKGDPRGDVKANVRPGEKRALDILRVKAIGHKKVGSLVVLKLGGNFDGRVGRRHLKRARAELAFVPRGATERLSLRAFSRSGHARTSISGAGAGTYAAVRRGHTIRFWVARPDFANFRSMQLTTRNGKVADTLKAKVAGSKEGCVTSDDIYRRALAERKRHLAKPADTKRMRTAMAAVISELGRRRNILCGIKPTPKPPADPRCNAFAEPSDKDVLVAETCNRSAVDTAVVQVPSGEKVTPNSADATPPRGDAACTIPDTRTVRCTPDQRATESTTIFFHKTPQVKVGDKLTLTLYLGGKLLFTQTLVVRSPTP